MLKSINLSLSSSCGGDCIYCPGNRGQRIKQKNMSFECVERIVDELASESFRNAHDIRRIELGENGDAFLNRDIIRILRLVRSRLPGVSTHMFSNFHNLTKDKAEIILKEDLLNHLFCNIDGSTKENYYRVKKLGLDVVIRNLFSFISVRNEIGSSAGVTVLTISLHRYIHAIHKHFNFTPVKLKDEKLRHIPDDSHETIEQVRKILDPSKDGIFSSFIVGWAERERVDVEGIDYQKYTCPLLDRVKNEAFIAPDGTWYACCLDQNNELVLGNVMEESLNDIFLGEKRQAFIAMLENREFAGIGGPCSTVNCCQVLDA